MESEESDIITDDSGEKFFAQFLGLIMQPLRHEVGALINRFEVPTSHHPPRPNSKPATIRESSSGSGRRAPEGHRKEARAKGSRIGALGGALGPEGDPRGAESFREGHLQRGAHEEYP